MISAEDIELIYSMWQNDFKMEIVPEIRSDNYIGTTYNSDCFHYNGYILRLDLWNNMLIIESADSIENAIINDYEDGYNYDVNTPINGIISQMKSDIIADFGEVT